MSDRSNTVPSSQGSQPPHLTGSDLFGLIENGVRENPLSAALIGMGALWLFMGGGSTSLFGNGHQGSVFRTLQHGADATVRAVHGAANAVGSSVSQATQQIGDTATQTIHDAAAATGDLANRSGNAIATAAQNLERKGEKWGGALQQNIEALFEQQPLTLGVLGIAIGAGIAASLPITEAEQSLMGEGSELVQNQISGVAEQVKDLASTALGEIRTHI
jgi:hypothetical protein